MKKREIKLGIPSYITVESEEGSFIGEQNSSKFEKEDICVEAKYSLQGTTQSRYLTGGVPPVRFSI